MDLNYLLLWMVGASCGMSVLFLLWMNHWRTARFAISLFMGVALYLLFDKVPDVAGYWGGALWGLLMLAPVLSNGLVNWCLQTERFTLAQRVAFISGWLHPFDGNLSKPLFIDALTFTHFGNTAKALECLDKLKSRSHSIGRASAVMAMRLTGDWASFIDWFENSPHQQLVRHDSQALDAYIQALAEVGHREEMFRVFQESVLSHRVAMSAGLRNVIRMKIAAFSGQREFAVNLLEAPLASIHIDNRKYWTATAHQSAGDITAATKVLTDLVNTPHTAIANAAQRRLTTPVTSIVEAPLSDFESKVFSKLLEAIKHETRFGVLSFKPQARPYGTWALITLLGLIFTLEIPGGSEDTENLIDLGALVMPLAIQNNEWWRVITAGVLHFGPLHLLLNCFGLLIFGPRLERIWGGLLMLTCFAVTSIGSVTMVVLLHPANGEPTVLVGASGGVMGLIGVLVGQLSMGVLKVRNHAVRQEFLLLFSVIVLQIIFDANTPAVSSTCHLMGLLIGFLLGALLVLVFPKRTPQIPLVQPDAF